MLPHPRKISVVFLPTNKQSSNSSKTTHSRAEQMEQPQTGGAAVQPGVSPAHIHDTDQLLDPVLFSNDNGSYKLNTVPAFRWDFMRCTGERPQPAAVNHPWRFQTTDNAHNLIHSLSTRSLHLVISTAISIVGIVLAASFPTDRRCDAYFIMLYLRATFWVITYVNIPISSLSIPTCLNVNGFYSSSITS